MTERDWQSLSNKTTTPWSTFSDEEFIQYYWKVVAPILEDEGHDPEQPPSAELMRKHAFGKYIQAIRRHYDYSFREFLTEEVGLTEKQCAHEYNWPIDDEVTKEWLDEFVRDLRHRDSTKEKESTIRRVAMNTYVFLEEWQNVHETENLIETLEQADENEAYELVLEVYDQLNNRDITENTKHRYVTDHDFVFSFLTLPNNPLEYNPIPDVAERFRWKRTETDVLERSALSPTQVKQLWQHTSSIEEKMILVAACAWGLRAGEIASLHIDQLILDPGDSDTFDGPTIQFKERKQGPSTVNIVYGLNTAEARIEQLQDEYGESWNGYLFPSADRRSQHLRGNTILTHRFQPLAERAGVTVQGDTPYLKQARRYWYQTYWQGQQRYHELVSITAEEQGSSDSEVLKANYLGDISRLEFARLWMRRNLQEAFTDTTVSREPAYVDDSSLDSMREAILDILDFLDETIENDGDRDQAAG
jgi:integrase